MPLDRAAYDRYVARFNAADPRFTDYYADDIKFLMNIRGKAGVLEFYARQRPYVKESLEVLFFCSDATGAAAEVHGAFRCIKDCDDPSIFGRALKAGEVQRAAARDRSTLAHRDRLSGELTRPNRQDCRDAWSSARCRSLPKRAVARTAPAPAKRQWCGPN